MSEHLLIVDDDRQLTSFLKRFFGKHGYQVTTAATASGFFAALERGTFDLVVLDLILPDGDGLEAARRLRKTSDIPVIMLTARADVYDRIVGLELGADDYVTKPYEPHELLARVRSVLRRAIRDDQPRGTGAARPDRLSFGGIDLDLVKLTAVRRTDGTDLGLTSTEFAMLRALADSGGAVLRREDILIAVYGNALQATDRVIDTHIVRLRRKLSAAGEAPEVIRTVHGVGYTLAAAVITTSTE